MRIAENEFTNIVWEMKHQPMVTVFLLSEYADSINEAALMQVGNNEQFSAGTKLLFFCWSHDLDCVRFVSVSVEVKTSGE